MPNNGIAIFDVNTVYEFDGLGHCVGEALPFSAKYMSGMQDMSIISVLSSRNHYDLVLYEPDTDKLVRYENAKVDSNIIETLYNKRGYQRFVSRKGQQDGIRFRQTLFIYPKTVNLKSLLNSL